MARGKREARRTYRPGKRIMSAFLAMVMCISLVQVGAFAAEPTDAETTQANEQILGGTTPEYYTWNSETEIFGESTTTEAVVKNNDDASKTKVTVSKTIAPTGVENEFEITLNVMTKESIESTTKTPDAAVVLVFDVSGSMDGCAECGEKNNHSRDCTYSDKVATTQSRLYAAQREAKSFLRSFAGFITEDGEETFTAPNAARKVAIVTYSNNASVAMNWVDVNAQTADAANTELNKINTIINNLNADGKTNIDAGLAEAETLLGNSSVSGVDNKFVLLLTDGEPNRTTSDDLRGYSYPAGYEAETGNDADAYNRPALRANQIRNVLGAAFYSINFGAGKDVSNWLTSISNKCVTAETSTELQVAFKEIIIRMMLAVDAWKVTDPMGQYMKLKNIKDLSNHDGAVTTPVENETTTLKWDLRADLKNPSTKIMDGNTSVSFENYDPSKAYTITYELKYVVQLDVNSIINATEAAAKKAGTDVDEAVKAALAEYYLTNGKTELDYYLTSTDDKGNVVYVDDNGTAIADGAEKLLSLYFKVPAVKGYATKLAFTKVGPKGEELTGAQFSLANDDNTWSDAATSDADGNVAFTKWIPSGDTYTLTETTAPSGYEAVSPVEFKVSYGEYPSNFKINNGEVEDKLQPAYTDVTITKTWRSPNGVTPDSITVTLKQNSTAMADYTDFVINKTDCSVDTLTGVWSYTFEDLIALDEDGNTYTYTVEESVPDGYKVDGQGTLGLINTATGKVNVIVTKDWLLPDTMNTTTALVDVILYANGVEFDREKNVNMGRTVSFMNLEKYDENGQTILYTVGEESDAAYQQVAIDKTAEAGPTTMYTIINTVAEEYDATVSGNKIWKDDNDVNGRPDSITVALYADGEAVVGEAGPVTATVTAADNWQYSFSGLQRYNFIRSEAGRIIGVQEIVYTVQEDVVDGYKSSAVGTDVINTRVGTVDFTVTKEWAADLNGAEHGAVSAILYANGHPVAESEPFTVSHTFSGLDKYDADGVAIVYDVIEVPVDGYTASYSDVTTDQDGNYAQTITNTRSDADDTLTVTVTKVWKQPGDVEAQTATFQLLEGEKETAKFLQITGNGVGYFENLPRYKEVTTVSEGEAGEVVTETELVEIDYNVKEINIPRNYTKTVDEELTPDSAGNFTCNFVNTITGTTDISVEKSWVKPTSIPAPEITVAVQVYDLDQGEWVALNDGIVIKSGESSGSLKNLPAYDKDGRRMSYRVTELSVPGYSSAVNGGYNSETGDYEYSIVNSINPSNSEITVTKQWLDGSRPAAERPSVTLQVLQSGLEYETVEFWYDAAAEKVMATTKYDTVDAIVSEDGNAYSVKLSVPDYSKDLTMKYTYSVAEWNKPAGYTGVVDGYTATNTRVGTIDIDVTKYWTDPGDVVRPDITLTLTGKVGDKTVETYDILVSDDTGVVVATMNNTELAVDANGNTWTITAAGLNLYHNGSKITYTLSEQDVDGYTAEPVDNQPFAINNVIVDLCDVTVSAEKKWGNMDVEGVYTPKYPESITVALFRDGVKVEGSEQTVTQENGYKIEKYTDLEKYAPNGSRYSYQILELDKDGAKVDNNGTINFGHNNDYTVTYGEDGTITNTFIVPAKYMWLVKTNYVHKNYDGTILLDWGTQTDVYTETESKTITVDPADYAVCPQDGLTYELDTSKTNITSVSLDRENKLYELVLNYILIEEEPPAPPAPPSNDTFLNVKKVWVGDDEDIRPESIEVQLLRDGEAYGETKTLSADNNWKTTWSSLSKSYDWSVEEVNVPEGYASDVTGKGTSWTITNTLVIEEFPEEPVPNQPAPDVDLPDEDVPDEDVPLADVPKTGDDMALWLMAAVVSGLGLAWMTITGKKREEV